MSSKQDSTIVLSINAWRAAQKGLQLPSVDTIAAARLT